LGKDPVDIEAAMKLMQLLGALGIICQCYAINFSLLR
jgi:hypothetical protein